jgi:hypothetical protein
LSEACLQLGHLPLEAQDLPLPRFWPEVTQGRVGFAVEALTGDAALPGMAGDVAVLAEEDDAGTGEAVRKVYDAHGVRAWGHAVGSASALFQDLTPLLSAHTP